MNSTDQNMAAAEARALDIFCAWRTAHALFMMAPIADRGRTVVDWRDAVGTLANDLFHAVLGLSNSGLVSSFALLQILDFWAGAAEGEAYLTPSDYLESCSEMFQCKIRAAGAVLHLALPDEARKRIDDAAKVDPAQMNLTLLLLWRWWDCGKQSGEGATATKHDLFWRESANFMLSIYSASGLSMPYYDALAAVLGNRSRVAQGVAA